MAKRIIQTQRALEEKIEILKYWNNRNKSNEYSKKLNQLFLDSTQLIQKFPSLGRPTEDPLVKNILARDYLIFYVETETAYNIVHIWDERRNPNEMIYKVL